MSTATTDPNGRRSQAAAFFGRHGLDHLVTVARELSRFYVGPVLVHGSSRLSSLRVRVFPPTARMP